MVGMSCSSLLYTHISTTCRRSTRQRKDVDYNEAHALVSLDDVKTYGSKLEHVCYFLSPCLYIFTLQHHTSTLHLAAVTQWSLHIMQAPQELPGYHPVESREEDVVQSSVDPAEGTRDDLGRLVFDDAPGFRPSLTPKQVIQAGSFGG